MERSMFFKSMTTFADHRVWQDVYHVPVREPQLYIKFQADIVTARLPWGLLERSSRLDSR
jgi:motility quorum-sensing regulator / GCU-specific mRNA interferase toxin